MAAYEDVQEEVEYWQQAVYGFIVGANPPWQILEGFLKRIWSKYNIDKISFLPNGVFIARFQTIEMQQAVLKSGHFLFDNKPMIIKPWVPDIELTKEEVNDAATEQKTRLGFARVMVELQIDQKFPNSIKFLDEKQKVTEIEIEYEWKPTLCTKCKQLGHEKDKCRKDKKETGKDKKANTRIIRKEWRPVNATAPQSIKNPPAAKIQSNKPTEQEMIKTPETRPGVSREGTLTPIKVTKQGQIQGARVRPGSPTYMEALSGSNSPKQGIGTNGNDPPTSDPCLYGLLETKIKPNKVNKAVTNVFSDWSVTTNTTYHPGGRIWVVWKPHLFDIYFLEYDAQYIHMKVYDKHTNGMFFFTVVYAFNGLSERESLWTNLRKIKVPSSMPWLIGGDFNCVLQPEERLGGTFNMAEADPFQKCIEDCEVMDIHTSGSFYTWNNKQPQETRSAQYPDFIANFLPEGLFDHSPCVIAKASSGQHRNRSFKYFNMWSLSTDFISCVSNVWNQPMEGTKMYRVTQKLRMLKPELKKINRTCYSDIENQALLAETKLFHVQQELSKQPGNRNIMTQEYEAHQASKHLQLAKAEFLKQKAKAFWMAEGDTNSSYFHGVIKARRNKNFTHQIKDHRGLLHTDESGIQQAFLEYYQSLLGSSSPTFKVKKSIVQRGNVCTEEQRQTLLSPVTHDEIKEIIFAIPNDKAPGPDGYSSKFFKDSWEIVGGEISNAVLDFF
ncbi:uncharacterized protein LOC141617395 [Silene latifolia]|uniref:uncharacterized protein LOC141617395 n=1 Tax=Silene latifolia TaxID=37657 RepID=UPI003D77879E